MAKTKPGQWRELVTPIAGRRRTPKRWQCRDCGFVFTGGDLGGAYCDMGVWCYACRDGRPFGGDAIGRMDELPSATS